MNLHEPFFKEKEQVQKDFPKMEVLEDRVTFRHGDFVCAKHVPQHGKDLRSVAQALSKYASAMQDLTLSMVGLGKHDTQCFQSGVIPISAVLGMCVCKFFARIHQEIDRIITVLVGFILVSSCFSIAEQHTSA